MNETTGQENHLIELRFKYRLLAVEERGVHVGCLRVDAYDKGNIGIHCVCLKLKTDEHLSKFYFDSIPAPNSPKEQQARWSFYGSLGALNCLMGLRISDREVRAFRDKEGRVYTPFYRGLDDDMSLGKTEDYFLIPDNELTNLGRLKPGMINIIQDITSLGMLDAARIKLIDENLKKVSTLEGISIEGSGHRYAPFPLWLVRAVRERQTGLKAGTRFGAGVQVSENCLDAMIRNRLVSRRQYPGSIRS